MVSRWDYRPRDSAEKRHLPQSVRDLSWVTFLIRNFTVPNHWNIPRLLKHAASSRSASQRIVNEKEIGSWAVTSNGTQSERLRIFAFQNVRECRNLANCNLGNHSSNGYWVFILHPKASDSILRTVNTASSTL
ncbi:unnamed protein product [Somion occarium]|uniref:Uncharacterized protein n=1 Tax=Somion occarium TaxID=3059160 RepID=A0ABP1DC55_9APHY